MIRQVLLSAALLALAPSAFAADKCAVSLEGSDAMKYNLANIDVSKSCKKFTINFKHAGKLAKNVMGHNVVIAKTADMAAIDTDGIKAGLPADYVKAGDTRIVAHSKMLGGGESATFSFSPAKLAAGGPYSFFCSFPGHASMMKGTITLKP